MSANRKDFIVLAVGDRDSCGYDEHTLPILVDLIDSSDPDARRFTHAILVAYYLRSGRAITAVESALSKIERLRDTDPRFASLGIGLVYGQMIADFDWLGRLKRDSVPLGDVFARAVTSIRGVQTYREIFIELHEPAA